MPPPKFQGIDFTDHQVTQLDLKNPPDHRGFRCSRQEFSTYWRGERIKRDVNSSVCQAWFIQNQSGFAGYITLFADKLEVGDGDQVLINEGIKYTTFPSVKIGLLAADQRAKGAGKRLVDWAVGYIAVELWPKLGIRFVTVDALLDPESMYDTSNYYRRFGFLLANPHHSNPMDGFNTMFLDLLPIVEATQAVEST